MGGRKLAREAKRDFHWQSNFAFGNQPWQPVEDVKRKKQKDNHSKGKPISSSPLLNPDKQKDLESYETMTQKRKAARYG